MSAQSSPSPPLPCEWQPRVILASQSPRRRDLLALIGVPHSVQPADLDESVLPGEAPAVYAERLARAKAAHVADHERAALVIGSDTIVVVDDETLGKPSDQTDAARMLRVLSGRTHTVMTAVAISFGGRVLSGVEQVTVTFRVLSDATIAGYIATGEPMDKAGAYGIQGFGATIVERIEGDFFAVMGLPLGRLIGLCNELGVTYRFGALSATDRASA